MFSGRGYCTQPTCFPVLGSPPILVFLCKNHCRHMLCYRHWVSHQTDKILDEQEQMDHSSSTVTLDSDFDEQENFPDLLKECTNQDEHNKFEKNFDNSIQLKEKILNETKEIIESKIYKKEIEWWNEITPWKNSENFNIKIEQTSSDDESDYMEHINKDNDLDFSTKKKKKISKKQLERSITYRSYSGKCPLTFDGAYGLIQSYHQHQLCSPTKSSNKKICLYQHFHSKHGFKSEISIRLVNAIIHHQDPYQIKLFSSINDTPLTLYDPFHKVKCPLSTTNYNIINTPCLIQEITRKSIRRHLSGVHRLDQETIDKLIKEMMK